MKTQPAVTTNENMEMDFIKIKISWLLADLANRAAAFDMDAVPMLPPTDQKAVFTESLKWKVNYGSVIGLS